MAPALPVWIAVASCLWLRAAALLPTVCVGNVTKPVSICCPVPPGASEPCGGVGYGHCVPITAYKQYSHMNPDLAKDDRMMWPTRFFQFGCQCEARRWGSDCGECFYGWKGRNCDEKDVRTRRNIFTLSKKERSQFQHIVKLMRHEMSPYSILIEKNSNGSDPLRNPVFVPASVHYYLVFIHRYAARKTLVDTKEQCDRLGKVDLNHGGPGFVTWHRYYTMLIERELHTLAVKHYNWTEFALPYWDWIDATWCEVCNNEMVGAPGRCDQYGQRLHHESPFHHWDEFCSIPEFSPIGTCNSCHYAEKFKKLARQWKTLALPTSAELEYGLDLPLYYIPGEDSANRYDLSKCSFNRYLEGHCGPKELFGTKGVLHNKVHDSVRGTFCCGPTSTNDPMFPLHHSQISRIVHLWELRHKPSTQSMANVDVMPGHSRQDFIVGFYPPIRHEEVFANSETLGYKYDSLEFGEPVRRRLQNEGLMPKPTLQHFMTCKPGFLHPEFQLHKHHFAEELSEFLKLHQRPAAHRLQ